MKIAVMADVETVDVARQHRVEASRQALLQRQQPVDQRPVGFLQAVAPLPERVGDPLGAEQVLVDPALYVLRAGRLRRESGSSLLPASATCISPVRRPACDM